MADLARLAAIDRAILRDYRLCATHFLAYKGIVSTEYLTNQLECTTETAVVYDPVVGLAFCHFAMAPKHLSLDYYEPKNEYFCNFQVDVSLRVGEPALADILEQAAHLVRGHDP